MLILLDSLIVLTAIYIGYFTLHPYFSIYTFKTLVISSIALLASHHIFAFKYRLYQKAWEYASIGEMLGIVRAVTLSIITAAIIQFIINGNVYVRVLGITWMLHIILIGGSRFSWRMYRDFYLRPEVKKSRALIIGAGSAGSMLVRQLIKSHDTDLLPVGFVDDDPKKEKLQIYGVTVFGKTKDIPELVDKLNIENIIIAIPSLSKKEIQQIYQECGKTSAKTQIMPMIEDLVSGKVSVNQIREVQVEDLLGREPVQLDMESIMKKITGKTILVTGAGGSIPDSCLKGSLRF